MGGKGPVTTLALDGILERDAFGSGAGATTSASGDDTVGDVGDVGNGGT